MSDPRKKYQRVKKRRPYQPKAKVIVGTPTPLSFDVDCRLATWVTQNCINGLVKGWRCVPSRTAEDGRNEILRWLVNDCKEPWSHLLWMDADTSMVHDYSLIRMVNHNLPVVAGVTPIYYKMKDCYAWSVVMKDEKNRDHQMMIDELPSGLFKAAALGGTSILIKREVIEKLSPPYYVTVRDQNGKVRRSEDYYFTDRIREQGYDLWVDPHVKCAHNQHTDLLKLLERAGSLDEIKREVA